MFVSKDNYLFQWILDIALRDSRSSNIRFACLTVCPTLLDDVHHNDNNIRVECVTIARFINLRSRKKERKKRHAGLYEFNSECTLTSNS